MILWAVKPGWGYIVEAYDKENVLLKHYEAGDCWSNPMIFGTGQIPEDKLKELALFSAKLVKKQYNLNCKIAYDENLLKW